MRMTYPDKSTRHGVFLSMFIVGCFLSIYNLMACGLVKYSDDEKNRLKWKGALLGCLFIPSVATIIGAVFLIRYVIRTYREIKTYGMEKKTFQRIFGLYKKEDG